MIRFDLGVTLGFGLGVTLGFVVLAPEFPFSLFHFSNKSENKNKNNNNDNNDVKFNNGLASNYNTVQFYARVNSDVIIVMRVR